ncbi:MAG: hypothetical protein PVS2B1_21560 [Candidatus Dormibacteraceae bacterium]
MKPIDPDVYFSTPGVATVRWEEKAKLVVVEWEGWADSKEFKELLDAEIKAVREHGGSRLLADCRQQKVINPADQDRANRDWLPRAMAAGLKRFAVVLPQSGLAAMNLKDALKAADPRLRVAYFGTVEEGRAWLAEDR